MVLLARRQNFQALPKIRRNYSNKRLFLDTIEEHFGWDITLSLFLKSPFTKLTRFILDKGLKARALSKVGQATNVSQYYFVQDLSLPKENVLKFLQFVDNELHIYPLWLCPLRPASRDKFAPNCIETDLVINVGVWAKRTVGTTILFV